MLQMSLSGAALILIIILIRALALHRLSKRFLLLLWNIPLARLLLPVSLPSPYSVYSLPERLPAPEILMKIHAAAYSAPGIWAGIPAGAPTVSAVPEAAHAFDIWAVIWFTGAMVCALFFTAAYIKCRLEFRESLPVQNGYAQEWLRQQKLRRTVVLRQSDKIAAPLTYGVLRPVILLPKSAELSDTETLRYVLTHEMVHIRRLDTLRKLVLSAALCVHWFNPLVWVMSALADRDMELTCDESVIRLFGADSRAGYAMALICMEQRKSGFAPLGSHFSKNAIEERITAIMKKKKNSVAALIAAIGLVTAAVGIFATSARAEVSENKDEPLFAYVTEERTVTSGADTDGTDYDAWGVEWWTPEEFAAWLEKEKQELQTVIGSQGWTQSTGWFTWTQEMVDETIARYEQTLRDIQGGLKLSKPVSGENEDTMILYGYDPDQQMSVDEEMDVWDYVQGEMRKDQERTEELLAPYIPFGLTFQYQMDLTESRLTMYWQGKPVRSLFDPERQIWVANSMGEGGLGAEAIELEAVYENGRLIGLQQGPDRDFGLAEEPE